MKMTRKTHTELRVQNLLFILIFLTLVAVMAWLSQRYTTEFDWSLGKSNSLSEGSSKIVDVLPGPVTVTAFARENKTLRDAISQLAGRYIRRKPDIVLNFVNPDLHPDQIRKLGIRNDGELLIEYQGRSAKVQTLTENAFSMALQQVAHGKDQTIGFLEGHGERSADGQESADLGQFASELRQRGYGIQRLKLASQPIIPDEINLLVIAGARGALLPGESSLLEKYMDSGRPLLWLSEPDETTTLRPLMKKIGITPKKGLVVDASTQLFGIDNPSFVLIGEYGDHPVTRDLQAMTMFPGASALEENLEEDNGYHREALLETLDKSWTESGPIKGNISFNEKDGESRGPFHLAYAITRQQNSKNEQRIIIAGDGDFLSNAYLGYSGNESLALSMISWLMTDDHLIAIPPVTPVDHGLQLSPLASTLIAIGFLFLVPFALIITGVMIWLDRRKR